MSNTNQQPVIATPRGIIRCAHCRTDDYGLPPPVRQGEHHMSVRFRDHGGGWTVLLDGEDVTSRAYEVLVGDPGIVYLYDLNSDGKRYVCPVGDDHAVLVMHTGRVSVQRRPGR